MRASPRLNRAGPRLSLQKRTGLRDSEQNALSLGDINNYHQPSTAMFFEVVILGVVRNMTVNQSFSGAACRPDDIVALSGT
jgi:hypothetical protein